MRRWRVALVLLLAAFLVGGHLYDITTQREHWPFSFYPMYGRVQKKPRLQVLTLCVITALDLIVLKGLPENFDSTTETAAGRIGAALRRLIRNIPSRKPDKI